MWVLNTAVVVGRTGGQSLGKRLAGTRIVHDSGARVGFGTGLLRDTVCRLLFVIPLVGLIDSLMPLGPEHQSIRDKMMSTRVVREPVYRSRRWLVTTAAVLVTGTWVALSVVGNTWDGAAELGNGYQAIDRDAFVSGCRDEGGGEKTCACAFDYIKARLSYDEYAAADPPRTRASGRRARGESSPTRSRSAREPAARTPPSARRASEEETTAVDVRYVQEDPPDYDTVSIVPDGPTITVEDVSERIPSGVAPHDDGVTDLVDDAPGVRRRALRPEQLRHHGGRAGEPHAVDVRARVVERHVPAHLDVA